MYEIVYARSVVKQMDNLKNSNLLSKFISLINILKINPYQTPPAYEKLSGEYKCAYSRRINIKHRLVYSVDDVSKKVYILSAWTHYEF